MQLLKQFITILFFFCSISIIAQNYQPISSGRVSYFVDSEAYIHAAKVDSVRFDSDSTLFFMKNIQNASHDCYTIKGDSWMGNKAIIQSNGDSFFYNKNNEPILIKANANIDDTWIAFEIEDSLVVQAIVIEVDTMSFLGMNDSVKIVGFEVFDEQMQLVDLPLNSYQIILSKNYGLVQTLSFLHFPFFDQLSDYWTYSVEFNQMPIVGMDNPQIGVQNLTMLSAFDFQPDDELHIEYESTYCYYSNKQWIKLKYLSRMESADTLYYDVRRETYSEVFDGEELYTNFIVDTVAEFYTIDTAFDKLPDQAVADQYVAYTNYMINAPRFEKSHTLQMSGLSFSDENCWAMNYFDGCLSTGVHKLGLGGPYYKCIYGSQISKRQLKYYQKGEEIWGEPIVFTSVPSFLNNQEISIYPNPANGDVLYLSDIQTFGKFFVDIYNSENRLVLSRKISESTGSFIDISDLSPGVYFVKFNNARQAFVTKLIRL
jgi:hypothetical protein